MKKKSLTEEAIDDARELNRLAVDAAVSKIVENILPSVKRLVDSKLSSGNIKEDTDRLRRAADGYGETPFEEAAAEKGDKAMDKELDLESIFPGLTEADDEFASKDAADEAAIPTLGEEAETEKEEEKEDMDEEIEISEAELNKVYKEALAAAANAKNVAEATVTKGFKDMDEPKELSDVDPAAGIADVKKGETPWEEVTPPAKQKYTMENLKKIVEAGLAENHALRANEKKLREALKFTLGKLNETNLFNAKVLHVNRMLQRYRLTNEQKKMVVESVDSGTSIEEIKKISSVLESTFKSISGVVSESRKKTSVKAGKSGGPTQKVLSESRDNSASSQGSRWLELAGLGKKR